MRSLNKLKPPIRTEIHKCSNTSSGLFHLHGDNIVELELLESVCGQQLVQACPWADAASHKVLEVIPVLVQALLVLCKVCHEAAQYLAIRSNGRKQCKLLEFSLIYDSMLIFFKYSGPWFSTLFEKQFVEVNCSKTESLFPIEVM